MTTVRCDRAGAEYLWLPADGELVVFWMMRTPATNALWRGAVLEPSITQA